MTSPILAPSSAAPAGPAAAGPAPVGPVRRLLERPLVAYALHRRGVALRPERGESPTRFEDRLGTALMALFRDERSEESFAALYELAQASVLGWIRALVRRGPSGLEATDVLQDTFVNVYRYAGGFRDDHDGSFRVWVRTIAGNLVRRGRPRSGAFSLQELPEGVREPADTRQGPAAEAALGEQEESLRGSWVLFLGLYHDAYRSLADRDREALHLVEVEGRSYAEAGERLRVGSSNMKMIIFRARKRLAAHMRSALARAGSPARLAS